MDQPMVLKVVDRNADPDRQERFVVEEARCLIGSGDQADLRLTSLQQPCHCEIVRNPGGVYVREIAQGLAVNGVDLDEAWLFPGDRVTLGSILLEIENIGQISLECDAATRGEPAGESREFAPEIECGSAGDGGPAVESLPVVSTEPPATHAGNVAEPRPQDADAFGTPSPTGEVNPADALWTTQDNDEAKWLDELYSSAVASPEPAANLPLDEQATDARMEGWQPNPVAPQLLQPRTDPARFEDLPQPTEEEANRILDHIESTRLQDESADHPGYTDLPGHQNVEPAGSEPAAGEPRPGDAPAFDMSRFAPAPPVDEPVTDPVVETPVVPQEIAGSPLAAASGAAEPEAPQSRPGESVAEVLARMKQAGQLDQEIPVPGLEDTAAEPGVGAAPQDQPVAPATTDSAESAVAVTAGGEADSDSSVQDYMNQLMQRLRGSGEGSSASVPVEPAAVNEVLVSSATTTVVTAAGQEAEDLTPANPLPASEFRPTNRAPEKSSTLDALRQIANQSVDSAIKASTKEKNFQTSMIYLGGSSACLFLSVVLFMLSKGVLDIAFMMAMLFAVGCVAMGFMFMSIHSVTGRESKTRQERSDDIAREKRQRQDGEPRS